MTRKHLCPSPRGSVGKLAHRLMIDTTGVTAIEYAVMTFIAIAVIAAVTQLGDAVTGLYQSVVDAFTN